MLESKYLFYLTKHHTDFDGITNIGEMFRTEEHFRLLNYSLSLRGVGYRAEELSDYEIFAEYCKMIPLMPRNLILQRDRETIWQIFQLNLLEIGDVERIWEDTSKMLIKNPYQISQAMTTVSCVSMKDLLNQKGICSQTFSELLKTSLHQLYGRNTQYRLISLDIPMPQCFHYPDSYHTKQVWEHFSVGKTTIEEEAFLFGDILQTVMQYGIQYSIPVLFNRISPAFREYCQSLSRTLHSKKIPSLMAVVGTVEEWEWCVDCMPQTVLPIITETTAFEDLIRHIPAGYLAYLPKEYNGAALGAHGVFKQEFQRVISQYTDHDQAETLYRLITWEHLKKWLSDGQE